MASHEKILSKLQDSKVGTYGKTGGGHHHHKGTHPAPAPAQTVPTNLSMTREHRTALISKGGTRRVAEERTSRYKGFWARAIPVICAFLAIASIFFLDRAVFGGRYLGRLYGQAPPPEPAAEPGESWWQKVKGYFKGEEEKPPEDETPAPKWLWRIWNFSLLGFLWEVFCWCVDGGREVLTSYQYGVVLGVLLLVSTTLAVLVIANKAQHAANEEHYERTATFVSALVAIAGFVFFVYARRHDEQRQRERETRDMLEAPVRKMPRLVTMAVAGVLCFSLYLLWLASQAPAQEAKDKVSVEVTTPTPEGHDEDATTHTVDVAPTPPPPPGDTSAPPVGGGGGAPEHVCSKEGGNAQKTKTTPETTNAAPAKVADQPQPQKDN